jgi:anti-sigma B factor antagonist
VGFTLETAQLDVSVEHGQDGVVVVCEGEVDIFTSPRFEEAIQEAMESGTQEVLIDMSKTSYCDSTGVQVMLSSLKYARERGMVLSIVTTPFIRRIFGITNIESLFNLYDNREAYELRERKDIQSGRGGNQAVASGNQCPA